MSSLEEEKSVPDAATTTITDTASKKAKRRKKPRRKTKPVDVPPEPVKLPAEQNLLHGRQEEALPVRVEEHHAKKEDLPDQELQTEPTTEDENASSKQEAVEGEVVDDQEEWVFISQDAM